MQKRRSILPAAALVGAATLLLPADLLAFVKIGWSRSVTDRHFRVFDDFADPDANSNTDPDPNFPGATGAALAIWKGAAEWGSGPFGDGSGDPTQANIGDGGANFDLFYAGLADGLGSPTDNIVTTFPSCSGGLVAFTEAGGGMGWRVRFCNNRPWSDAPGAIPANKYDLQGIAAAQFGVALGLSVTSPIPDATMYNTPILGDTKKRSLHADDIAGVQCIYGVKSATKPVIEDVVEEVGRLTILGANFAPLENEVWFTPASVTAAATNPTLRVLGVPATAGGTRIEVVPPAGAGAGNVAVKVVGSAFDTLSNAFPTPVEPFYVNGARPAQLATDPVLADTGGDPLRGPKIASNVEVFNLSLDCTQAQSSGIYIMELRAQVASTPATAPYGFVWGTGPKYFGCAGSQTQNVVECVSGGLVLPNDPSFIGLAYSAQGFCGGRTSNAVLQTVGA